MEMSRGALQFPDHSDLNGPCYLKTLVSDKVIGRLMGKQGQAINQLVISHRVTVRISATGNYFPGGTDRVVIISGDSNNLEAAVKAVVGATSGPLIASSSGLPYLEPYQLTLVVPNAAIGSIGDLLRNLCNVAGASIRIHPRIDGISERAISLTSKTGGITSILTCVGAIGDVAAREGGAFNPSVLYEATARPVVPSSGLYASGILVEPEASESEIPPGLAAPIIEEPVQTVELKIDPDQAVDVVPDSLLCKICHSSILGCFPKRAKCGHSFCGDCFEQWTAVQPKLQSWANIAKTAGQARLVPCPVCKTPLNDKTDVFSIFSESSSLECADLAKALSSILVRCHNHPTMNSQGNCDWQGKAAQYQEHGVSCTRNASCVRASSVANVGPGSVDEALIPFASSEPYTISVRVGDELVVQERSENGLWVYGKANGVEGWFPDYCSKRYSTYFESEGQGDVKTVERCAVLKEFISNSPNSCISVKEGEVVMVLQRGGDRGWALAVSGDGLRIGWIPENRCKTIREGSTESTHQLTANPLLAQPSTFVARRSFDSEGRHSELTVTSGDIVSVRKSHESGWTLGVVVANGSKKEGWFPDWVVDRGNKAVCVNCGTECVPVGSVKVRGDSQGSLCSTNCWEKWIKRVKAQ